MWVADVIAPLNVFVINRAKTKLPPNVKQKLSLRKWLLKRAKPNNMEELQQKIIHLNQVKKYFNDA